MPESKAQHDTFRPGGSLAVLDPSPDPPRKRAAAVDLAFPREEDIRLAQDLLFFAYRDFTNAADVALEELGLGRAHHRALHFIGRNPGITVSELLAILRITKQSLARVLGALLDQGYVAQAQGDQDRRQRLLTLTPPGQILERRLFERQQARLAVAYRRAGAAAVEGFRGVMLAIMDEEACRNIVETHAMVPLNASTGGAMQPGDPSAPAIRLGEATAAAMRPGGSSAAAVRQGEATATTLADERDQAAAGPSESLPGAAWLKPVEQG